MDPAFADRLDAGRRLGHALGVYASGDAVVIGLARGGVEVAYAAARYLRLPLTVLVVRKLGSPPNPELAIGAVSETGVQWLDPEIIEATGATAAYVQSEVGRQVTEAQRRREAYGAGEVHSLVRGHPAIIVDDGIATGSTAMVAIRSVRGLGASQIVLATPVASPMAVRLLQTEADRVVALETPSQFGAVGSFYGDFHQVSDEEVVRYLELAREANAGDV
jgi:putative phosphoribosyl transferase